MSTAAWMVVIGVGWFVIGVFVGYRLRRFMADEEQRLRAEVWRLRAEIMREERDQLRGDLNKLLEDKLQR